MSAELAFSEHRYPTIATAGLAAETERARVRGHAAGYAEGLRAAEADAATEAARTRFERDALREDAAAALSSAVAALGVAAQRFAESSAPVLASADETLLSAAVELAESILGCELDQVDRSARVALSRALSSTDADQIDSVRLSPVDLAVIEAHGIAAAGLTLVGDATLAPGDAVVEIADGRIDARISSALARARAEIGAVR